MKTYKLIGIAAGAVIAGTVITLSALNPTNHAETSETATRDLQTRHYDVPNGILFDLNAPKKKTRVISEIEEIVSRQRTYGRSWKITETKTENDLTLIKTEVPVVIFTDDLEVEIRLAPPEKPDSPRIKATVNVRSKSRLGQSDLGENRRHIKKLLEEFDFAFGNDRL